MEQVVINSNGQDSQVTATEVLMPTVSWWQPLRMATSIPRPHPDSEIPRVYINGMWSREALILKSVVSYGLVSFAFSFLLLDCAECFIDVLCLVVCARSHDGSVERLMQEQVHSP